MTAKPVHPRVHQACFSSAVAIAAFNTATAVSVFAVGNTCGGNEATFFWQGGSRGWNNALYTCSDTVNGNRDNIVVAACQAHCLERRVEHIDVSITAFARARLVPRSRVQFRCHAP